MTRYFTHGWNGRTCDEFYAMGESGLPLVHTAGSDFKKRGIKDSDVVFIVNVTKGQLFLIGRIIVDGDVRDYRQAQQLLGEDIWEAPDHLIAKDGSGTPMCFTRTVDLEIVEQLRFISSSGEVVPLKFEKPEFIDRQTLRSVRELTLESAALLEAIIEQPYEDEEPDVTDDDIDEDDEDDLDDEDGQGTEEEVDDDSIEDEVLEEIVARFGNPEHNKIVERAAVALVTSHLESKGWAVRSREQDRCGYDLHCTRDGEELHVEVKGTSGDQIRFIMTDHEFTTATEDDDYLVYVVTEADTDSAALSIFDGEQLFDLFRSRPTQWAFQYTDQGSEK